LIALAAAIAIPAAAAPLAAQAASTAQSLNWAGYVVTGGSYSDVKASWTQPSVSCTTAQFQAASFWVGMGGVNSGSIEQIGTEADCAGGSALYSSWLEMYPNPIQRIGLAVEPGDTVSAEVSFASGTYTLSLSTSSGGSYSKSFATAGDSSSAEFIVEAPSSCTAAGCTPEPLANFGTVSFSGATATPAQAPGLRIQMVTAKGTPEAMPTGFHSARFSVVWIHS
jgi:hypothetical protein